MITIGPCNGGDFSFGKTGAFFGMVGRINTSYFSSAASKKASCRVVSQYISAEVPKPAKKKIRSIQHPVLITNDLM